MRKNRYILSYLYFLYRECQELLVTVALPGTTRRKKRRQVIVSIERLLRTRDYLIYLLDNMNKNEIPNSMMYTESEILDELDIVDQTLRDLGFKRWAA